MSTPPFQLPRAARYVFPARPSAAVN